MVDVKMPLTAHLEELRWRLIKSLAAVAVAFFACYAFVEPLFTLLKAPLQTSPEHVVLMGTGLAEAFFTKLKVSLIAAIFLASPVLFYQLWQFVAPGLYETEKGYVKPFVFFGSLFFVSGAAFCYLVVFPVAFAFFIQEYKSIGIDPNLKISEYLSFSSRMLLAFGVTFEMPVLTFFLARIGVVTHRTLISYARYAIVVIFIVAAVLTPGPDVASQLLMAAPLLVLYGISIGVAYAVGKPAPAVETETPEERES